MHIYMHNWWNVINMKQMWTLYGKLEFNRIEEDGEEMRANIQI